MTRNIANSTPTAEETQALTTMAGQSDTLELQTLRCLSELTTSQLTVSLVHWILDLVVIIVYGALTERRDMKYNKFSMENRLRTPLSHWRGPCQQARGIL